MFRKICTHFHNHSYANCTKHKHIILISFFDNAYCRYKYSISNHIFTKASGQASQSIGISIGWVLSKLGESAHNECSYGFSSGTNTLHHLHFSTFISSSTDHKWTCCSPEVSSISCVCNKPRYFWYWSITVYIDEYQTWCFEPSHPWILMSRTIPLHSNHCNSCEWEGLYDIWTNKDSLQVDLVS